MGSTTPFLATSSKMYFFFVVKLFSLSRKKNKRFLLTRKKINKSRALFQNQKLVTVFTCHYNKVVGVKTPQPLNLKS